jgi:flagella basal body P-ring formation protein FlgA
MNRNHRISSVFHWPARLAAGLTMLLLPALASAQSFENLDKLDNLVAMTVGANLGEPGGPVAQIDRRLRLKPCPSTPKIDGPTFGAAIVSCTEIGWRLRVPLVPIRNEAGNSFTAAKAQAVSTQVVIKKGDPVELVAGSEAFSVSRPMIAEEDGSIGAVIRVRETPKSSPIMARVESAGVVRAPTI